MNRSERFSLVVSLSACFWLALAVGDRARAGDDDVPAARGFGTAAPNPVAPIVDRMKSAATRLKQGDTGADTRTIQEQVVKDLDKLIEAASQQSQSGQGGNKSNSGSQQQSQQQQQSEAKASQQSQGAKQGAGAHGSAAPGGAAPGTRGGSRNPKTTPKTAALNNQHLLLHEVWGHLPPALREHVRADFSETVLPAYDDLVRRYFEALLEESPQRNGTPAAPSKTAPAEK
jgi:hypothetical protein